MKPHRPLEYPSTIRLDALPLDLTREELGRRIDEAHANLRKAMAEALAEAKAKKDPPK